MGQTDVPERNSIDLASKVSDERTAHQYLEHDFSRRCLRWNNPACGRVFVSLDGTDQEPGTHHAGWTKPAVNKPGDSLIWHLGSEVANLQGLLWRPGVVLR